MNNTCTIDDINKLAEAVKASSAEVANELKLAKLHIKLLKLHINKLQMAGHTTIAIVRSVNYYDFDETELKRLQNIFNEKTP